VIQTADAEAEESAAEKEAAAASLAKTTGDDADGEFLKFCACDKRAGDESKQRERKEGGGGGAREHRKGAINTTQEVGNNTAVQSIEKWQRKLRGDRSENIN
jgi:type IV secretory pathway TrbL component